MLTKLERRWRRLGIRYKLVVVICLPTTLLVTLVLAGAGWAEYRQSRAALTEVVRSLTGALSQDLALLRMFEDQRLASDIAERLRSFRPIERMYVYDLDGGLVFGYRRPDVPASPPPAERPPGSEFDGDTLKIFIPLFSGGSQYGLAYVQVFSEKLVRDVRAVAMNVFLAGGAVICAGVVLAWFLQAYVSRPVLALEDAARIVLDKRDYSVRAIKHTEDELGVVIDAFNSVLTEVEARDIALKKSHRELEERVEHRTRGMADTVAQLEKEVAERRRAERELEAARETAEGANRLKSGFLTIVSHELRTPMTALLGYIELLRPRLAGADGDTESLDAIEQSGRHLLALVDDILDLSRIESGKLVLERVEFSLPEIVDEVLSLAMVRALEKGLRLEARLETAIPRCVVSDPTRVRQVLINLLGNAVKFTEKGTVSLTLRLLQAGDGAGTETISFEVADSGGGIPPESLSEVFEPFSQLAPADGRAQQGLGLGLSICRRLAEYLGGELTARSNVGVGSVFTFTMRCEVVDGTPMVAELSPPRQSRSSRTLEEPDEVVIDGMSGRVLLVEDTVLNQKLICRYLEVGDLSVDVAGNGKECLEKYREGRYDLIIMDLQMPVMDGFRALSELRRQGATLPVIALTAHAMKGDGERCLEAGFDAYLPKPVRRAQFLSTVASLLREPARDPA